MIEAEGLTKRYGPTVALAGIDLQVPAGAILGVLGPNGAGKPVTGLRHSLLAEVRDALLTR
jgi:ABC-type multidrug transport system ATPase subunit